MSNKRRAYWGGTMPPCRPKNPRPWSVGYVHTLADDWYLLAWQDGMCYRGYLYRLRPYSVLEDILDENWQANAFGRRSIVAKAKSILGKALGAARQKEELGLAGNCLWMAEHAPGVLEFLTALVGPGGEKRQTATITIYFQGGMCHVVLSERDQGLKLFASGDGLLGTIQALDGRLVDEVVDWQVDDRNKSSRRR